MAGRKVVGAGSAEIYVSDLNMFFLSLRTVLQSVIRHLRGQQFAGPSGVASGASRRTAVTCAPLPPPNRPVASHRCLPVLLSTLRHARLRQYPVSLYTILRLPCDPHNYQVKPSVRPTHAAPWRQQLVRVHDVLGLRSSKRTSKRTSKRVSTRPQRSVTPPAPFPNSRRSSPSTA